MSGTLSLEQVLARSLRAPRRGSAGFRKNLTGAQQQQQQAPLSAALTKEADRLAREGKQQPTQSAGGVTTATDGKNTIEGEADDQQLTIRKTATPTSQQLGLSKQPRPPKRQMSLFSLNKKSGVVGSSNNTTATSTTAAAGSEVEVSLPSGANSGSVWLSRNSSSNIQDKSTVLFSARKLGDWTAALGVLEATIQAEEKGQGRVSSSSNSKFNWKQQQNTNRLMDAQLGMIAETCIEAGQGSALNNCLVTALNNSPSSFPEAADTTTAIHVTKVDPATGEKRGGPRGSTPSHQNLSVSERLLDVVLESYGKSSGSGSSSSSTADLLDLVEKLSPERRSVNVLNAALGSFEGGGSANGDDTREGWEKALQWFHTRYNVQPLPGAPVETTTTTSAADADSAAQQQKEEENNSKKPSPNVVTFATLMAVLESAGKNRASQELLHYYVPVDQRSAIMSSYAALIVVWSRRYGTKGIKKY